MSSMVIMTNLGVNWRTNCICRDSSRHNHGMIYLEVPSYRGKHLSSKHTISV